MKRRLSKCLKLKQALKRNNNYVSLATLLFFTTTLFHFCPAQGKWVCMKGITTKSYGSKGVPSASNSPGTRYEAAEWKDATGNFWIFGGMYLTIASDYNDLWMYNPATNIWTWMNGRNTPGQADVYGTQGVPDPANTPGARKWASATWVDTAGNLWLFGGDLYNDLWKYDPDPLSPTYNQWTWMGGGYNHQAAVYGIKGVFSPLSNPGNRAESPCTWVDKEGCFWMFGGQGYLTGYGQRNDLWKYDPNPTSPTYNQWAWMSGDDVFNKSGIYGQKGIASATNKPGARNVYASWKDSQENFWFFGGQTYDANGSRHYNDLWKYETSTNQWTWMSGDSTLDGPGYYGTTCEASPLNLPPARYETRSRWIDDCDNLWLFGGAYLNNSLGTLPTYNDLWKFNTADNQWTWMSGDDTTNQSGVYGTIGVAGAGNKPGSRMGANSWKNEQGMWLFGGNGKDGVLNDMWRYIPDTVVVQLLADTAMGCSPLIVNFSNNGSACDQLKYTWNFGDTPSGVENGSNLSNPNHQFNSAGTYSITLSASDCSGNSVGSSTSIVNVEEECGHALFIPNSFTPNRDNINDVFYVYGNGIDSFSFSIFNRWGEKIFDSSPPSASYGQAISGAGDEVGWDGKYKGAPVKEDVYIYSINGLWKNGQSFNKTGRVTVVR